MGLQRRVGVDDVSRGTNLYASPAYFEFELDESPEAQRFREAVSRFAKRNGNVMLSGRSRLVVEATHARNRGPHTITAAQRIEEGHKRFIRGFEKVVDGFLPN